MAFPAALIKKGLGAIPKKGKKPTDVKVPKGTPLVKAPAIDPDGDAEMDAKQGKC